METRSDIFPQGRIAVLGLITIAVYGAWYYSFGVLLDPIIADTGWSESTLTAAFGLSSLVGGVAGLGGGWLLDRFGSRFVFALGALSGASAFWVASVADQVGVFSLSVIIGGASVSALGMYHITQTAAVRISPTNTTKAIAVLTIWGAFASAIYVPIAGWIVAPLGWRVTLRVLTGSMVVMLAVGSMVVATSPGDPGGLGAIRSLRKTLSTFRVQRYVAAIGLVGIATATLLVYQVPAMTAAGLPLAAASFWAGFRGFSQLGGRLPLMPLVRRFGVLGSLRIALVVLGIGMFVLAGAGSPWLAFVFAILAGFGVGALSPLQGMTTRDLFDAETLGTAMGLLGAMFLTVGAIGPVVAGVVAESTGSRAIPVIGAACLSLLAAVVLPADEPH